MIFSFYMCSLEFSSRYHNGRPYIIDVSQSVTPDHPHSLEFLRKDCTNITGCYSLVVCDSSCGRWCNTNLNINDLCWIIHPLFHKLTYIFFYVKYLKISKISKASKEDKSDGIWIIFNMTIEDSLKNKCLCVELG